MQLKLTFLALVMLSSQALAGTDISVVENSQTTQSQTQSLQQKAGEWGLSPEDYQRYQQLMNGPRGIQSPGLDPLSALGIEARTPAERRQYAEKWVKEEFARTQKELDFQREINTAWQRLYPDRLPVNLGNAAGVARDTGGRLALFVKSKNCPTCDARVSAVLSDNRPVDIYLVDSEGSDDKLRQWARAHRIPAEKVRSRQITLNHDGGRWLRFGDGMMPVLLQQGEKGWHIAAF